MKGKRLKHLLIAAGGVGRYKEGVKEQTNLGINEERKHAGYVIGWNARKRSWMLILGTYRAEEKMGFVYLGCYGNYTVQENKIGG